MSRPLAGTLSAVIAGVAAAAIVGHHRWSGPEIFSAWGSHGVHYGDLGVLMVAVVAVSLTWRFAK